MKKTRKITSLAMITGMLFATGMTFSNVFVSNSKANVPVALGDDGEVEKVESLSSENTEEKNADDNTDAQKNENKQAEQQNEEAKKNSERIRETEKTQNEWQGENEQGSDNNQTGSEQENKNKNETEGITHDAQEDAADFSKKVARIESRIATLATADPEAFGIFNASLEEIKTLIAQLDTTTDPTQLNVLKDDIDHKVGRLDDMMEVVSENGDDDKEDVAKEYKNTVAQFAHTLKVFDETDNEDIKGIGEQVRVVAQAQNESQVRMDKSIEDIKSRSEFVKLLVGPNYGSIAEIQATIIENETRIKVLTELLDQVTDPAVKIVLQAQVSSLQQQNTNLQTFATESESGVSLFGWLAKWLS